MKKTMYKKFELGDQPHVMSVNAQAVWNNDKGCWEVNIVQSGTGFSGLSNKYSFYQSAHHIEVADCNEFVIADALLHINGIKVQDLYQCPKNPIVNGEW